MKLVPTTEPAGRKLRRRSKIHANIRMGVQAEYKLIRRKAITDDMGNRVAGPVMEESPWTKNLLTLTYFNQAFITGGMTVRGIVVGAGTTAAAEGDSALVSYLANTTTRQEFTTTYNATVSPRHVEKMYRYRFGEGVAAGNIAEVGMFTSATSGTVTSGTPISSRARVVDGLGAPTAITVLSDEFLDVIWRCRWYVPEDVTGTCNISIDGVPTSFDWTLRAVGLQAGSGPTTWWGNDVIGFCPSSKTYFGSNGYTSVLSTDSSLFAYDALTLATGESGSSNNLTVQPTADAYTANSKNRTFRLLWGLTQANIAFQSMFFRDGLNSTLAGFSLGSFQILLDAPITKVNTKTMLLIINMAMDNVP